MNHLKQLGIPIALAVGAGFFNWASIQREKARLSPRSYVVIVNEVKAGTVIKPEDIAERQIRSDGVFTGLRAWVDSDLVVGAKARYTLVPGTLITESGLLVEPVSERIESSSVVAPTTKMAKGKTK